MKSLIAMSLGFLIFGIFLMLIAQLGLGMLLLMMGGILMVILPHDKPRNENEQPEYLE